MAQRLDPVPQYSAARPVVARRMGPESIYPERTREHGAVHVQGGHCEPLPLIEWMLPATRWKGILPQPPIAWIGKDLADPNR